MAEVVRATAYLVVKASRRRYAPSGQLPEVDAAKITQARASRPTSMGKDEILVKVTVELPKGAFDPIAPDALIVVPEDMVLARHQLEAEVTGEPNDG